MIGFQQRHTPLLGPSTKPFFGYLALMYAVLSLIRRAAVSIIYVKAEQLRSGGIPIEQTADVFDISRGVWLNRNAVVPMFKLEASSESSVGAASKLSAKENQIFKASGMDRKYFTLLIGPENEHESDGVVVRTSRIGVVRGVFRSPKSAVISPATQSEQRKARRGRRLPKNVTFETR